ncbi:thioredoxin family protein [Myroides sp. 1354]|uniref:thioredoxin family protein n=1 Tax=unclassified Myroides TaxID=2642485 RepID=UPI002579241A|nr:MULTISPECIES: thioredoxin family protein [unclassified Myroides]MDM1045918.1 thioredoxin family protein [Myroides sp. R163-1]MDM1056928.1 thioredoxin family protein [Myroides sp. 1354]MDM1070123.1 thioredoxin family protein [Myroides sp. 1372]
MKQLTFYHAGCPVCVSAEQDLLNLIADHPIEIIHLGEEPTKVQEAEGAGVKSVPALVLPNGHVLHINFGASIADLK